MFVKYEHAPSEGEGHRSIFFLYEWEALVRGNLHVHVKNEGSVWNS